MKVKFFCIKCDIFTVEEVISMKEKMNYFYYFVLIGIFAITDYLYSVLPFNMILNIIIIISVGLLLLFISTFVNRKLKISNKESNKIFMIIPLSLFLTIISGIVIEPFNPNLFVLVAILINFICFLVCYSIDKKQR